ncbi:MAG TPA: bifunctional [glutamate--ammonia ligase]-adenylyl-L-tyrosine phosphorylase/[glutamate--ammonia-ligase] adenylyltransferase, partial [Gemmataceae bacterium]|nr:bifunctional [glutamate--ammonia ligase]-adenylyl-L-tyrosine phosphorylase/[glutamate--ammonia-ligase] adenylyltransferase [Gemmataceae bacterium]
ARPVHGDPTFAAELTGAIRDAMFGTVWGPAVATEIRSMRERLEVTAPARSLKRGPGGMVDVEFLVQAFQLKYGRQLPDVCRTNTWDSLDAFRDGSLISPADHATLSDSFSFHRLAEARLRIVTNRPLNEYPQPPEELEKLARRMGFRADGTTARERLLGELTRHARATREAFDRLVRE